MNLLHKIEVHSINARFALMILEKKSENRCRWSIKYVQGQSLDNDISNPYIVSLLVTFIHIVISNSYNNYEYGK